MYRTPISGPWSDRQLQTFLTRFPLPMRLSVVRPDGFPLVASLWFQYRNGYVWAISHRSAYLLKAIGNNARVGFDISVNDPPYKGVRGTGEAELLALEQRELLAELLSRYGVDEGSELAQWLVKRSDEEVVVRITPRQFSCWDFSERMRGACRESAFYQVPETPGISAH